MIKNIIFDIGNVLSDFSWKEMILSKGFDEEMAERIARASVNTVTWYEFDKGVYSDEEVVDLFAKNDPEIADAIHKSFDEIYGMVKLKKETPAWLSDLKSRGYKLYYLSNYSQKALTYCPEATPFFDEFDGGILSFRVKLTKPDPRIYKLLLDTYSLDPGECVFIDDTLRNVKAAEEAGIRSIRYLNSVQAHEDLEKVLMST